MENRKADINGTQGVPAKRQRATGIVQGFPALDIDALESALASDGVVRAEGLYSAEQIATWVRYHEALLANIDKECANVERTEMPYLTGLGEKQYYTQGYWPLDDKSVVLDLGHGRLDFTKGCEDGPFAENGFHAPPPVTSLMRRMLKADFAHYVGAVPSRRKSDAGLWHRDTYSLFDDDSIDVTLPPYYYTMLVPLSDVTQDLGPTQFAIGSHRLTHDEVEGAQLAVGIMSAGDALIFDGRMAHRGLENVSDSLRPMMIIVWHKKWYHDYSECYFKDNFQSGGA